MNDTVESEPKRSSEIPFSTSVGVFPISLQSDTAHRGTSRAIGMDDLRSVAADVGRETHGQEQVDAQATLSLRLRLVPSVPLGLDIAGRHRQRFVATSAFVVLNGNESDSETSFKRVSTLDIEKKMKKKSTRNSSRTRTSTMGRIMVVVAVLSTHIERNMVTSITPNINLTRSNSKKGEGKSVRNPTIRQYAGSWKSCNLISL